MKRSVIILAAGQGTRMVSNKPKVLHELGGYSLIEYVYHTAKSLNPNQIYVVHGNKSDQLKSAMADLDVQWVEQTPQMGTGDAVMRVLPYIDNEHEVLVLYGDVPLINSHTLKRLIDQINNQHLGILTSHFHDPNGFGRITRNDNGSIMGIVEDKEATPSQKQIHEVNTGILAAPAKLLHNYMPLISADNHKGEYYLTDLIHIAYQHDYTIINAEADSFEVTGVNTRYQLCQLERALQRYRAQALMAQGVHIYDPERLDIRGQVHTGIDTFIDSNCLLEGRVIIGANSTIGPNCHIKNTQIGDNVHIAANSVIEGSTIANDCQIGPFARLRANTILDTGAKIGNFVETKNAQFGAHAKASHLAYLGDSVLETEVNIGAGTITCNYDGQHKHQTYIKQGAFIGSNCSLVAPITLGCNVTVGAGSVITSSVEDNALAVARGQQRNISQWHRSKFRSNTKHQASESESESENQNTTTTES